jgi:hypothetical protein
MLREPGGERDNKSGQIINSKTVNIRNSLVSATPHGHRDAHGDFSFGRGQKKNMTLIGIIILKLPG